MFKKLVNFIGTRVENIIDIFSYYPVKIDGQTFQSRTISMNFCYLCMCIYYIYVVYSGNSIHIVILYV